MKTIVMFSGGVGCWAAAKRLTKEYTDDVTLLFADTKIEDEDLYRFLDEAASDLGYPLVKISDGRDVWEVFKDTRFIRNSRIDPCSRILKRELLNTWLCDNCNPRDTTVVIGFDWSEIHRLKRLVERNKEWNYIAPMCDRPYLSKDAMLHELRRYGIQPPRLYDMGFPHNNCGGFCVKAGHAQFKLLLDVLPDRYRYHEKKEEEMRQYLGSDIAILRDRTGGKSRPLTLRELRERVEIKNCEQLDLSEWGGCGCAY